MLASTVQFSTNNQPTTHSPTPNLGAVTGSHERYARPGHAWTVPKQQPAGPKTTVVLSGLNRVLIISHQPHQQHLSTTRSPRCVLSPPAVAEENSPVSPPTSTPPPRRSARATGRPSPS